MIIVSIRRKEERRSGNDRRRSRNPGCYELQERGGLERRKIVDRRIGTDRRKSKDYILPAKKMETLESILEILEDQR